MLGGGGGGGGGGGAGAGGGGGTGRGDAAAGEGVWLATGAVEGDGVGWAVAMGDSEFGLDFGVGVDDAAMTWATGEAAL